MTKKRNPPKPPAKPPTRSRKSSRSGSNIYDIETGEKIKLRARSRGSIKDLAELNRFLYLNKRNKINGYVLGYLHEPTREDIDQDYMFSFIVDSKNDQETMTKLYFWLGNVRDQIAQTLMKM